MAKRTTTPATKMCSGAPTLGIQPHEQDRALFASDSTPDGLYRMCKPCDSVTQRAYRIRLRLRALGLTPDNATVRAILETPALMPKSPAEAARWHEPAPAPTPTTEPLPAAEARPATRPAPKPSKSTPEQRARWAAAKRAQRAAARA